MTIRSGDDKDNIFHFHIIIAYFPGFVVDIYCSFYEEYIKVPVNWMDLGMLYWCYYWEMVWHYGMSHKESRGWKINKSYAGIIARFLEKLLTNSGTADIIGDVYTHRGYMDAKKTAWIRAR